MTSIKVPLPTNKRFGLFLTIVLSIISAYCYLIYPERIKLVLALTSGALLTALISFFKPDLFLPLNKVWFFLGQLLGSIVSPIILGFIFFLIITPTGLISRIFGRDELSLKRRNVDSYWIDRKSTERTKDFFKNQF